jgi:N-acetylmuramoyl-L-alanine amidase
MFRKILPGAIIPFLLIMTATFSFAQPARHWPEPQAMAGGEGNIKVVFGRGYSQAQIKSMTIGKVEFIPLREITKIFEIKLEWDPITKKVQLSADKNVIEFVVGNPVVLVNSDLRRMTTAPRFREGAIVVPLEFITEIVGDVVNVRVDWDPLNRILKMLGGDLSILGLRHYSDPKYTRIVIDTIKPLKYEASQTLSKDIEINITGGRLNPEECSLEINDKLVKSVRAIQGEESAKIVIALKEAVNYDTFTLRNPDRIVIGLKPLAPGPIPLLESLKVRTIVLDPGHGGKDPGAIGPNGLKEKDVTLDIAKRLKKLLVERLGVRVVLTREDDYFVPLAERTGLANNNKADLFISIHTNASPESKRGKGGGFEVYFHSLALDEESRQVAARENLARLYEEGGSLQDPSGDLYFILWDLAQNEFMKESSELAEIIQSELDRKLSIINRGVKQAPFYVLAGSTMPAVLVEVAFISNWREERMLRKAQFKEDITEALCNSVTIYKKRFEEKMGFTE